MFKNVGQHAEELAARLPRRAFFGKVAQAAMPVAAALGGLLALSRESQALGFGNVFCCYDSSTDERVCQAGKGGRGDVPPSCPEGTYLYYCRGSYKHLPFCS